MAVDPEKLREELQHMKELIATDPRVLAHFDADGNGIIDGDEWESVRQLVIHRLERQQEEARIAKEALSQLDPEQAAELARMEREMMMDAVPDGVIEDGRSLMPETEHSSVEAQDWGNLELAFDPHEARVAESVYREEVVTYFQQPVRTGHYGTLADRQELVLKQAGGMKQLFGNMFRRSYEVLSRDGDELGQIVQHENEMVQDLTNVHFFEDPDLHFTVYDDVGGEEFQLKRSSGLSDNSVRVMNPKGRVIATTSWTLSFLRRKYEVAVPTERISYYVRRRALNPFTYDVLDHFEEPIGTMERGWSGLGFVTGGNLFRINVEAEVTPEAMWGFLATALLADLDSEPSKRRKSLLDFG